MPQTNGEWLRERVDELWRNRQLEHEPTYDCLVCLDMVVRDSHFEGATEVDPIEVVRRAAAAYRLERDGERLPELAGLLRKPKYPRGGAPVPLVGSSQASRSMRVAASSFYWGFTGLLRPFSDFLMSLDDALRKKEAPSDAPWCHRLEEVSYVVLLTHPREGGHVHGLIAELARRYWSKNEALPTVLDEWTRRTRPIRRYTPRATSAREAATFAYNYARVSLKRQIYRRQPQPSDGLAPRQTVERWMREGYARPRTPEEVEAIYLEQERLQTRPSDLPSQNQVAKALKRSRSTIAKYTPEASRLCGVEPMIDKDGTIRYPHELVRALIKVLPPPRKRQRSEGR